MSATTKSSRMSVVRLSKGKGCNRRGYGLNSNTTNSMPVLASKGECHPCRERRGKQGEWVVHVNVDIRHGPCKDVYIFTSVEDECALQRLSVLGPVSVSRDICKQFLHVIAVCQSRLDGCFKA